MDGDLQTHRVSGCVTERRRRPGLYRSRAHRRLVLGRASLSEHRLEPASSDTILPLSSSAATIKSRIDDFERVRLDRGPDRHRLGLVYGVPELEQPVAVERRRGLQLGGDPEGGGDHDRRRVQHPLLQRRDLTAGGFGVRLSSAKIDCDATNGDPFDQSRALCTAMKAQGVIVYTVGFGITAGTDEAAVLRGLRLDPGQCHSCPPTAATCPKPSRRSVGTSSSCASPARRPVITSDHQALTCQADIGAFDSRTILPGDLAESTTMGRRV